MVKPDDQDSTRERIVKAAGELIVEVGWADVTTRQISERAGVNNALIHYYFGSKDDLLLEAAATAFTSEAEGPFSMLVDAGSVTEALRGVFRWLGTIEVDSPMMIISMEAAHRATRDERVASFLEGIWSRYFEVFASVISHGQAVGELREDLNPRDVAVTLGALLDGLFLYRLVSPDFDIDGATVVVDALIESLTKGRQP
jgi:AcrR family transcriptional regulator